MDLRNLIGYANEITECLYCNTKQQILHSERHPYVNNETLQAFKDLRGFVIYKGFLLR